MSIHRTGPSSSPDYPPIMAGLGLLLVLGLATSAWPVVGHLVGVGLAVLTAAALLALVARTGLRRLREYREDQADAAHATAARHQHQTTGGAR
jgi:UPF0716 family protein affecting phage T7 exclusion